MTEWGGGANHQQKLAIYQTQSLMGGSHAGL